MGTEIVCVMMMNFVFNDIRTAFHGFVLFFSQVLALNNAITRITAGHDELYFDANRI